MSKLTPEYYNYALTLTTSSPGFDDDEVFAIRDWCKHNSDACFLVEEVSSHRHLHAAFRCTQKTTVQVTRKLAKLYEKLNLPWVAKVSCKVRRATVLVGWFHYLRKEMKKDEPLLLTGWKMTWIAEQCAANLKKIPHKVLLKHDYQVSTKNGTAMVIEYAKRKNLPLCDKYTFADVLTDMAADSYTFESVRIKWLFCQVMARCGERKYMKSHILNELSFIGD